MKSKDKHINKFLHGPLPDPEIPVDDAWAGMNDMLGAAAGQGADGTKWPSEVWKSVAKLKGMFGVVSAVVATSAIAVLFILNTEPNNRPTVKQIITSKTTGPAPVKTDFGKPDVTTDTSHSNTTNTPSEVTSRKKPDTTNRIASTSNDHSGDALTQSGNGHAKLPAARTRFKRMNALRTGTALIHNTEVSVGERSNQPGDITIPIARRVNAGYPTSKLNDTQAVPEAITSNSPEKTIRSAVAQTLPHNLASLPGHFKGYDHDLSKLVKQPAPNKPATATKTRRPLLHGIHFGPEWSMSFIELNNPYLLTGIDSIKRPARLAVPGIFVTKNWNRHAATFTFTPLYSYFGNNDRVSQRADTTRVSDSLFFVTYHNMNFIKAVGMSFALQYQFEAASWLSATAGISYTTFSGALLRNETITATGYAVQGGLVTVKGREAMRSLLNPQQWALRAGVLCHPHLGLNGRLQIGLNIIVPVSTLAPHVEKRRNWVNGQLYLRFLIK